MFQGGGIDFGEMNCTKCNLRFCPINACNGDHRSAKEVMALQELCVTGLLYYGASSRRPRDKVDLRSQPRRREAS